MPKLKVLSGNDVLKIFYRFGFEIVSQRGSHIKLKRINPSGVKETLTIPRHDEIDKGTLQAIFKQAIKYIPENDLRPYFFDD